MDWLTHNKKRIIFVIWALFLCILYHQAMWWWFESLGNVFAEGLSGTTKTALTSCLDSLCAGLLPFTVLVLKKYLKMPAQCIKLQKRTEVALFGLFGLYYVICFVASFWPYAIEPIVTLRSFSLLFIILLPFIWIGQVLLDDGKYATPITYFYGGMIVCSFALERNFHVLDDPEYYSVWIRQSGWGLLTGVLLALLTYTIQKSTFRKKLAF